MNELLSLFLQRQYIATPPWYICSHACQCVHKWRLDDDVTCLPQSLSILFLRFSLTLNCHFAAAMLSFLGGC